MFPVFSLVLDKDVTSQVALTYPELYKELTKVRHIFLLFGSAVTSVFISIYFYSACYAFSLTKNNYWHLPPFLLQGRSLSLKTFFIWVLISIYQGMWFKDRYTIHQLGLCLSKHQYVQWYSCGNNSLQFLLFSVN